MRIHLSNKTLKSNRVYHSNIPFKSASMDSEKIKNLTDTMNKLYQTEQPKKKLIGSKFII